MKVLIYTHEFPPFAGGAGIYAWDLAKGMSKLGVDIHILTTFHGRLDDGAFNSSSTDFQIHYMQNWQNSKRLAPLKIYCLDLIHAYDLIIVAERRAQELVAGMSNPWFRYIVITHGTDVLDYFVRKKSNLNNTPEEMSNFYKNSAVCIASSKATKQLWDQFSATLDIDVTTVTTGIDTERLISPDGNTVRQIREKLGPDSQLLFSLGRLDLDKGHDVLIRAFKIISKRHPRAKLLISGIGPLEYDLKELCDSLALTDKVLFLGKVLQPDIPAYFALSNLFVMPSKCEERWEGFGLVFLEAGYYKLASVGGNEGGVPEAIVDGETGYVVNPRSPVAVAMAISKLLSDPDLAKRMGNAAHERVICERNSRVMASETINLIRGESTQNQQGITPIILKTVRMAIWPMNFIALEFKAKCVNFFSTLLPRDKNSSAQ